MDDSAALPGITRDARAFSHAPEHGFSLFLANRTKTIHFVRHAEGTHNAASHAFGDETPTVHSTPGAWDYVDARLTDVGIAQCVAARHPTVHAAAAPSGLLANVHPQLVVVSPFSRALQTAHIMFGGRGVPFIVHDLCAERSGYYTCDKRRDKVDVVRDFAPIFAHTHDSIDFESYGFPTQSDERWSPTRESPEAVTERAMQMMQWLASRPESEIALVTHSSWLKHLFNGFGGSSVAKKDLDNLHRLAGNAEVRSVCLALHRGFYPEGEWEGNTFIPSHTSFRRYRWAPTPEAIANMHKNIR
ncbi:hypothetical protein HDU83_005654 [Entophlyctis luteolus]|nr:hypothetical protein HDU82_001101 [Entophlyctis luteolus]KAJ3343528.1 hypothetical protein HDU83_005654 [Entophlyctis luteolus]KAJ3380451.1 hypothetical protein HDU84_005925 [Entophlyctis sp. JEL0112]